MAYHAPLVARTALIHRSIDQWHPDKNQQQIEMATEVFKQVQAAYAVLSDPQERSWYDAHREAILRGKSGTSGDEFDDPVAHLWAFFSTSAYSGYGDDEDGFYAVYDAVFHGLESEEKAYARVSCGHHGMAGERNGCVVQAGLRGEDTTLW